MSGRGSVEISAEVLMAALHMPPGTRIVGASLDTFKDTISLRVEHADLPGDLDALKPTITHHIERYEWNWNLPAAVEH